MTNNSDDSGAASASSSSSGPDPIAVTLAGAASGLVVGACKLIFETSGLRGMYFQPVKTKRAINAG